MSLNPGRRRTNHAAVAAAAAAGRGDIGSSSPARSPASPQASNPRRSGRFGSVIRRLFGRKSIKSQIGPPSPPHRPYGDVSSKIAARTAEVLAGVTSAPSSGADSPAPHYQAPVEFITTPDDPHRYPRAVSLPVAHPPRGKALGSHAPFDPVHDDDSDEAPTERRPSPAPAEPPRPLRSRRATLPSRGAWTPPPAAPARAGGLADARDSLALGDRARASRLLDPDDIGFAVTSGSNPQRRSRSAEAYADAQRASPTLWRRSRRRSDEIRYWRESVGPLAVFTMPVAEQDPPGGVAGDEATAHGNTRASKDSRPRAEESEGHVDAAARGGLESEGARRDERRTFDFGALATDLRAQEDVGIDERVVTLEVKLMDLEYAIARLQATVAAAAPPMGPTAAPPGTATVPPRSSALQPTRDPPPPPHGPPPSMTALRERRHSSVPTTATSQPSSESAASGSAASTQRTAASLVATPPVAPPPPPASSAPTFLSPAAAAAPGAAPLHSRSPSAATNTTVRAARPAPIATARAPPPAPHAAATDAGPLSPPLPERIVSGGPSLASPASPSRAAGPGGRPLSVTGFTVDHLNTLVGLIRQERAARHRLEDAVAALQAEAARSRAGSAERGETPARGASSVYSSGFGPGVEIPVPPPPRRGRLSGLPRPGGWLGLARGPGEDEEGAEQLPMGTQGFDDDDDDDEEEEDAGEEGHGGEGEQQEEEEIEREAWSTPTERAWDGHSDPDVRGTPF